MMLPPGSGIAREQHWMHLARTEREIVIAGRVPDETMRTALVTYASALFGADQIRTQLKVSEAPAPVDWQVAALGLLDQLLRAKIGEARLAGYAIDLHADLSDPAMSRLIHDELSVGLPDYAVRTSFSRRCTSIFGPDRSATDALRGPVEPSEPSITD